MGPAALFAAGAWLLQQQPRLPSLAAVSILVPLLLCARYWWNASPAALRIASRLALGLACFAAGFYWAAAYGGWRLADELPARWEGRDVRLRGTVTGLPERTASGWRFGVETERVITPDAEVPHRLLITLMDDPAEPAVTTEPPVEAGERIVFTARLRRPHGTYNPHGFDFEGWLLERGFRATGYVRTGEPFSRERPVPWQFSGGIDRWRASLRSHLLAAVPESAFAGVLVALAIGDQQAITAEQWQVYTRTGVNHLMSISGLHITMLGAVAGFAVSRLWRRSSRLVRALPAVDAGAWAGLATAFGYAMLSGFAVPAQRTLWMLATAVIAGRLRMRVTPWDTLGLALAVVVAADPMAVISPGFWLSFGAVAWLMFAGGREERSTPAAHRWSRAQWALFLGLTPLLVAMFQQVSIVGPLANAFAIPLVSLAVVPLTLAATVLPWSGPAQLAAWLLDWLHTALSTIAAWSWAQYVQPAPPAWTVPLACAGALWLLLPRGFPSRWVGVLAFLPLVAFRPDPLPEEEALVTMLDVGQGLAVLVRTRDQALLFDTGPGWSAEADSASRVILPYLRGEGIDRLGALVVSHDDRDHTGGARSLVRGMAIDSVLTSLPASSPALGSHPRVLKCVAGQSWTWSGVNFAMLYPSNPSPAATVRDNARSCVLRVEAGGRSVLVAADIERDAETEILRSGAALESTVLVVPHHGSATSSTPAFVAAVHPQSAWFAVGYRNRFGHPHPDVISRYREMGVTMARSDVSGAVTARLSRAGLEMQAWRRVARRYWHTPIDSI
ncbi:MAG: DNA internalization-related competence protein ComEC/Rec2 [Betaproteobacteria bacterium]|nr:DNA internalization-related competence protein ComEC/Rec2 [Betaproteobacteria bacterium]